MREKLAEIHATGVFHGDLHWGAIMQAHSTGDFRITDFSAAEAGAPDYILQAEMLQLERMLLAKLAPGRRPAR